MITTRRLERVLAAVLAGLLIIIALMILADQSGSRPGEISVGGSVTESSASNQAEEADGSQTYGAQPPDDLVAGDVTSGDDATDDATATQEADGSGEATDITDSGSEVTNNDDGGQDSGSAGDSGTESPVADGETGAEAPSTNEEGAGAESSDDGNAAGTDEGTEQDSAGADLVEQTDNGEAAGDGTEEETVEQPTEDVDAPNEVAEATEDPPAPAPEPEQEAPAPAPSNDRPAPSSTPSVFIYSELGNDSRTGQQAFFHESTPGAVQVIAQLARGLGMEVTVGRDAGANESAGYFTSCEQLKRFDVMVFVNTSGDDILNSAERDAMQCWTANPDAAPGFIGIHGTAESLGDWDYFNDLIGARFNGHAREQDGELHVNPPASGHPSVAGLPGVSTRLQEEWYVFRNGGEDRVFRPYNPRNRPGLTVVLDVNEATYLARDYDYPLRGEETERMFYSSEIPGQPGSFGRNHPIAWYQEFSGDPRFGNTRSFYTALGHGGVPAGNGVWSGYADAFMQNHLQGALRWAAGIN